MAGTPGLMDYYAVLCVSRNASAEEICASFIKLAMHWRPERHFADKETALVWFQHVQQAYKVLSDPTRKAMYDAGVYDPTSDKDDTKVLDTVFLKQMMAAMARERDEEQEEEHWGVIADEVVNLRRVQEPKKNAAGSSSSSAAAPVVRVDVTFNNDDGGSSTKTTPVGPSSSRATAGRRTPRRRMCYQHPIFKADLQFPDQP